MTRRTPPPPPASFDPVPVRRRADGWTPERQAEFIRALAGTANVEAAARAVGMGTSSAYELRARPDAGAFREAWRVALDYAVHRLGEAVLDRALHGTATPVFYKGEQIGERRRYDDRLAMFVLRMRDPERFGSWHEGRMPIPAGDAPALRLAVAVDRLAPDRGRATEPRAALEKPRLLSSVEEEASVYTRTQAEVEDARRAGRPTLDEDDCDYGYDDDVDHVEPDTEGGT